MKIRFAAAALILAFVIILVHSFSPSAILAQSSPLSNIRHVFIIVMENHDATSLTPSTAPYLTNTLTKIGGAAMNYHNVPSGSLHPSEPNYTWLEGATNVYPDFTFTNDSNSSAANSTGSTAHLATLLTAKGFSWKAYQENIPAGCPINSSGQYAAKHNPFVFFRDISGNPPSTSTTGCTSHMSNLTASILQSDLANGNVANYNFLTPNLCNDMHDCSVTTGDTWLSTFVPIIMNSNLYKQDGAIFITWDEGGSGNNPIGMFVLSPYAKVGHTNNIAYSHASFVKTVENIFGLSPLVGHAADSGTVDLSDFFGSSNQTPVPTPIKTPSPSPIPTKTPSPAPSHTPTPTGSGLAKVGDINSDGKVDIIDIGIIIDNYGKSPIPNPKADINKDGTVDIVDIGIVIDNYGK